MLTVDPTSELHNENKAWQRDLANWKEELFKLNKQVNSITESWVDEVEKVELLKFQKRFDTHINDSRELVLAIEDHEDQLQDDSKVHYHRLSEIAIATHANLSARVRELQKEYHDIKTECLEFLTTNFQ